MDDVIDVSGRRWNKDVLDERASNAAGGHSLVSRFAIHDLQFRRGISMMPHRIAFAFDILNLSCCRCFRKLLLLSLDGLESVVVTRIVKFRQLEKYS